MGSSDSFSLWNIFGPIAGAIVGFFGNVLVQYIKRNNDYKNSMQNIECIEIVNTSVNFDKKLFGAFADRIQVNLQDSKSNQIKIREIYFSRYRIRNISPKPVNEFTIKINNSPDQLWVSISEGDKFINTDSKAKIEKSFVFDIKDSIDEKLITIPFLNPYKSSNHEIFLDISSYMNLNNVIIQGGAKGINLTFSKEDISRKKSIFNLDFLESLLFAIFVLITIILFTQNR